MADIEKIDAVAVAIIGGGPAGLMAAEVLSAAGVPVHLFDAMASVGRKFLLAGRGGLNLTHSENADLFAGRYGARRLDIERLLAAFHAPALRAWAHGLGVPTFVGSSGRVFPQDMKAAPLLRAWLHRLRHPAQGRGVSFHMRHRWLGWDGHGDLLFGTPSGVRRVSATYQVLALGGGSWARLGSDGAWVPLLQQRGIPVAPLRAANCGFDLATPWSDYFRQKFAGQPFKSVAVSVLRQGQPGAYRKGEFVATDTGLEGSLVYAASAALRDEIEAHGKATLLLDLLPDYSAQRVLQEVSHPRGARSLSSHLKGRLHLSGIKAAVLREVLTEDALRDPVQLASALKSLPLVLAAPRPLDEAISSAGGVLFEALTPDLMVESRPGLFCAGEMLDWEAPTGGYLLQASMASGVVVGRGILSRLEQAAADSAIAGSAAEGWAPGEPRVAGTGEPRKS